MVPSRVAGVAVGGRDLEEERRREREGGSISEKMRAR